MRAQPTRIRTGAIKKRILCALFTLIIAAISLCGWYIAHHGVPYSPPPFEAQAVIGVPQPPDTMGYGRIDAEGGFSFSVVGTMYQQEDGSLLTYFTNHEHSGIWMMCEIADENGKSLYKSGVLRPGEYVERLYPERKIANEATKIEVMVYGFEPETYYSRGSVSLNNILQPW